MPEYSVLSLDHLDLVVALDHAIFVGSDRCPKEYMQKYCEAESGIVAMDGADLVGFVLFKDTMLCWPFGGDSAEDEEKSMTITSLAVDAKHRRCGIAETLMKMALAAIGCTVYLHVRASNQAAQNLYEKLGFKMAEVLDRYYGDEKDTAIYMRRTTVSG